MCDASCTHAGKDGTFDYPDGSAAETLLFLVNFPNKATVMVSLYLSPSTALPGTANIGLHSQKKLKLKQTIFRITLESRAL